MKKNYLTLMPVLLLSVLSAEAQTSKKYDPEGAYQQTMRIEGQTSKARALKEFGKKYGLDEKNTFEIITESSDISGLTHQRHQQFYKGLKVEFGTVITHERNGSVESVNGELYNPSGLSLTPSLTAEQGFNVAVKSVNAQKYLWEDEESSRNMEYSKPKGELVIFPIVNKGIVTLAYKYDVYALAPISREEIYVDAVSGSILYKNPIIKHANRLISNNDIKHNAEKVDAILANPFVTGTAATRYSGTKSIETTYDSATVRYRLEDRTRGAGIITYNSGRTNTYPSTHFTDTDNVWNNGNFGAISSTKDNGALDAHWGAMMTYDFWKNIFNRNSFDNKGALIRSYIHYDNDPATPQGFDNAFWNGSVMTYGDGNTVFKGPATSIDICAHEIGHAICTYTANLAYQNQSGAMNEGFSDIWGACIEQYGRNGNLNSPVDTAYPGTSAIWKIGEDITTNTYGGYLRSMSYPNAKSNPDTYKGTYYITTADDGNCVPNGDTNDYCGVHSNSGVLNHWFYILTAGKSGTNNAPAPYAYNVTGIGMAKSSQIAYLAERDYLTSNSTFMDARNATIAVACSLYCATSEEVKAVTDAWYAVNVGAAFSAPAIDVSLKSIVGGTENIICGAYNPTVTLENGGTNSLTSVTITYNVDGGSNSVINWTGNLANCSQATQVLPISGLTRGLHTVNVSVTTTNDAVSVNNAKTLYLIVNNSGTVNVVNSFTSDSDVLVSIDSSGKTNTLWERGTINKNVLTSAVTGNSAGYSTKLVGDYPDKTTSYLVSQCYNLANVTNPSVSFDMAFDLESNWDIIYFEYSTDSGATWNVLGTSADANWYNSSRMPDGTDCFNCIGKQWTGLYGTAPTGGTGVNGNKRTYTHTLNTLGAPASAIFRFTFISDEAENENGVFIDNFVIQGTLGTNENSFEKFAVYPNPSNGKFNVVLSTAEPVKLEVFDIRGRSVYGKTFESEGTIFNKEIDLNSLSSGVYILNVNSGGKREAKRIIIE